MEAVEWSFKTNWLEQETSIEHEGGDEVIRMRGLFSKAHPEIFVHIKDSSLPEMAAKRKADDIMKEAKKKHEDETGGAQASGSVGAVGSPQGAPGAKVRKTLVPRRPQPNKPAPKREAAAPA